MVCEYNSDVAVGIAPAKNFRATFDAMSHLQLIPSPCKGGSTFLESVAASFNNIAVQEEGEEEKAIHSPGAVGLHEWLEGCLDKTLHCGVSAFDVSVDSVKKVFMDNDWLLDMSFKWNDVANLLEALGRSEFKKTKEE
jgi:hypothetical protein